MTNNKTKNTAASKKAAPRSRKRAPRTGHDILGGMPKGSAGINYSGSPVQKHGDVVTRIHGCDMVADIFANEDWLVQGGIRINPGDPAPFPRLSSIAKAFEKYRFRKLAFKYFPITAATRSGAVVFAFETDVRDAPFTSKEEMLNHFNSRRCSPWTPMVLEIAPKDLHPRPQMFVRPETTTSEDARLDDLGTLYIGSTVDNATPISVGELWVEYDIDLISPCVQDSAEETLSHVESDLVDRASPAAYIPTVTSTAASNWGDFYDFIDGARKHFGTLGPVTTEMSAFLANADAAVVWTGAPSIYPTNGVTARNNVTYGDRSSVKDGAGGWGYVENIIGFPGTIANGNALADLLTLPNLGIEFGTISAGTIASAVIQFMLSPSTIKGVKPPPFLLSRHRNAFLDHASTGNFHVSGRDTVLTFHHKGGRRSFFLTGRGRVPEAPPIRHLIIPTPGEPESTCAKPNEGACPVPGHKEF